MENKIIIGGAVVAGICAAPFLIGFGTGGVAAGSIAAGIQSSIGCVQAGSLFATTQSLVMTGAMTNGIIAGVSTIGAGIASKIPKFWKWGQSKEEDKNEEKTENLEELQKVKNDIQIEDIPIGNESQDEEIPEESSINSLPSANLLNLSSNEWNSPIGHL